MMDHGSGRKKKKYLLDNMMEKKELPVQHQNPEKTTPNRRRTSTKEVEKERASPVTDATSAEASTTSQRENEAWRSKSGNQDWRSSYGKGVGKGKGTMKGKGYVGKMKGKGKGTSKGYGKKGQSFGKRSWYNMASSKRGLGGFSEGIPDASSTMNDDEATSLDSAEGNRGEMSSGMTSGKASSTFYDIL